MLYAVVLAFVVVTAWQERDHAEEIVLAEETAVDALFFARLPHTVSANDALSFRRELLEYAAASVDDFASLNHGVDEPLPLPDPDEVSCGPGAYDFKARPAPRSSIAAACIGKMIRAWQATSRTDQVDYGEGRLIFRSFLESRAHRIHHSNERLPPIMWSSLVIGAIIIVIFTFLFDEEWSRPQAMRTAALSAMIGLMLAQAIVFDHPFVGSNRIESKWQPIACEFNHAVYNQEMIVKRSIAEPPATACSE